ncbi:alpha/beta hydrolase [Demequina sp. SYSU T00192]|uniref:Alpha/beta hydrolase n=1 Tax=Demequina litoralis TaxID=3051660 RepID=A0ABT8GB99_9MICO|nr:alpha/beta hydrolase [Demequina sp. SYSU T00192]MDN4476416.1 alpha/beta hydrolase [Demequina sp. SYSU T00192]
MSDQGKPRLTAETRQGLPGSFLDLPTGVTHYELVGDRDAPTVVLVHGNAAPYVTWDRTVAGLVDAGLRVLRYDVLGHGFSDRPDLPTYDRSLYDTQLTELLDALGITGPVRMAGSSQGGSIAACFAASHPGRVSRLALLAPFFDDLPGSGSVLFRIVTARGLGELAQRIVPDRRLADLADAMVDPGAREALQPEVMRQFEFEGKRRAVLANLRGDALRPATACYQAVKEQGIPVLLTYGTEDQKLPEAQMRRLREFLPDLEYREIEGVGHLAHYELPDVVTPILARFLAG